VILLLHHNLGFTSAVMIKSCNISHLQKISTCLRVL